MTLKDELYAVDSGKIFAENIDRAWDIYSDKDNSEETDRLIAQSFLIYAFDLQTLDDLNEQLLRLMNERNKHKAKNPEYIPGLSPNHLNLKPKEMLPGRTSKSNTSKNRKLSSLFKEHEMLDVRNEEKLYDSLHETRFFSCNERARYRVHIYKGQFYKQGELFDTQHFDAHLKKGFAAFTINANGELSVFPHLNMTDKIGHSSMNAGNPVVCAGELIITNGKLLTINTYSGHYSPSLFNTFRALEYFSEHGVDISQTKIHSFANPNSYGLDVNTSAITITRTDGGEPVQFYETHASLFFSSMKEKLQKSLASIQSDTKKYQSASLKNMLFELKDKMSGSDLTLERKKIASQLENIASELSEQLTNDDENSEKLVTLVNKLKTLQAENTQLSRDHDKSESSGRLSRKIDSFLLQAQAIPKAKLPEKCNLNSMKSAF